VQVVGSRSVMAHRLKQLPLQFPVLLLQLELGIRPVEIIAPERRAQALVAAMLGIGAELEHEEQLRGSQVGMAHVVPAGRKDRAKIAREGVAVCK